MHKYHISRIAKFVALLLPVALMVLVSQYYLFSYADPNTERLWDFYNEEEDSLDVVVLGASEVFTGFLPAHAYEQYGFTSYPYAIDGNPASLYKPALKEILKNQNPGLIIVEVNGFLSEDELTNEARLRTFTESIPMSWNKIDTIFRYPYKDKLSCLLPFIKYHGDWTDKNILSERFAIKNYRSDQPTLLKGMTNCTVIDKEEPIFDVPTTNETKELVPATESCLIEFLEYCKQLQMENLIFVRFPHKFVDEETLDSFFYANRVGEIVGQYGYPFINLEQKTEEMGIDYMNDFFNPHHLNFYGKKKVTDYLGNLIMNQYHLTPAEQTEKNKAHWEEAVRYKNACYDFLEQYFEKGEEVWMMRHPYSMRILEEFMRMQDRSAM